MEILLEHTTSIYQDQFSSRSSLPCAVTLSQVYDCQCCSSCHSVFISLKNALSVVHWVFYFPTFDQSRNTEKY